ncbi:hypothetical protein DL771_010400 [Monosporascus sp. 5C6A]|nr:hypothetical protein DL771_010400 [Monosporascus sp. 5C6A]
MQISGLWKLILDKCVRTISGQYPTVWQEMRDLVPSRRDMAIYIEGLFPFADWIPRYNSHWFLGDVLAGFTVGLVIVPQAMAYAILAQLTPECGLYTSFARSRDLLDLQHIERHHYQGK